MFRVDPRGFVLCQRLLWGAKLSGPTRLSTLATKIPDPTLGFGRRPESLVVASPKALFFLDQPSPDNANRVPVMPCGNLRLGCSFPPI